MWDLHLKSVSQTYGFKVIYIVMADSEEEEEFKGEEGAAGWTADVLQGDKARQRLRRDRGESSRSFWTFSLK